MARTRRRTAVLAIALLVAGPALAESARSGVWIANEETSSYDGKTTITAMAPSPPASYNDPAYVVVRCLGGRTEMLVGTSGGWGMSRTALEVVTSIDGGAEARSKWDVSTNGKAVFLDSGVEDFLRTLPDTGKLTVRVLDRIGAEHANAFDLTGFGAIRAKVAAACGWTP